MSSKRNTSSMFGGGVRPVYEVIKPMSEWNEEEDSNILLLYLPGFMKEQIKVSTEGVNTLRIQGERLVAGNKWNRFEEDFRIPDRCHLRGIHAKVQGGVLIVTMPNKTAKQPNNIEGQQRPPLIQEPVPNQMSIPELPQSVQNENRTTKGNNLINKTSKQPNNIEGQQRPLIQEPVPNQIYIPELPLRVQNENRTKGNNLIQKRADEKDNNLNMPKLEQERGKEPDMVTLIGSSSNGETRNPQKGITALDKEKDKTDGINFQLPEQCRQAIKGLGIRRMSEERQLLVNMGASILVMVAFGAYLFSGMAKR